MVIIGILIAVRRKGLPSEEEILPMIIPHVPIMLICSTMIAAGLVFFLKVIRWLPPPPRSTAPALTVVLLLLLVPIACLGGQVAISWLQALLGYPMQEQPFVLEGIRSGGLPFFLAAVILGPLGEELVFRRYLFSTFSHTYGGRVSAYALTGILFALIHFNFPGMLLYAWMGCCFGFAYERTGSVWVAFGTHAINNAAAVLPPMLATG